MGVRERRATGMQPTLQTSRVRVSRQRFSADAHVATSSERARHRSLGHRLRLIFVRAYYSSRLRRHWRLVGLLGALAISILLATWSWALRSSRAEQRIDTGGLGNVKASLDYTKTYDVCAIGAGLSGTVLAERFANVLNQSVLVLDQRWHFGGNCYDYVDERSGVRVNKYGAHLFHTNSDLAWRYINMHKAAPRWRRWDHRVKGVVDGKLVPIPVNILTVNTLFGLHLQTDEEMRSWLNETQRTCPEGHCRNAEDMALSRVGDKLFEAIFRHYTRKQWNKEPRDLDAQVTARIPVRASHDERYFSDRYQVLPEQGYTAWFAALLNHSNIDVVLSTDFFDEREHLLNACDVIAYTGPIDRYFEASGLEELEYRSIDFVEERCSNCGYMQPNSVVNYPGPEVAFTRRVEYKHFLHQKSPHSVAFREYSTADGEPYYPVPSRRNLALYEKYRELAAEEERASNVYFVGRLANYRYFNMDAAIVNALDVFAKITGERALP
eukprot:scaffold1071_cov252-Pinguiococcus_pyrenoidosus.AAC.5